MVESLPDVIKKNNLAASTAFFAVKNMKFITPFLYNWIAKKKIVAT